MGFTQVLFLFIFMPVSILLYLAAYRLSGKNLRFCNGVLIFEGLLFYCLAEPRLCAFFISLTILMHIIGVAIHRSESNDERNLLMMFGVIILAFLPVIYRYLPAMKIMTDDMQPVTMPLFESMLVPVGLTFFTLEAISYILDIYAGKESPGTMMDAFVFTMLFPKAVCGPVVLWRDFSHQIHDRKTTLPNINNAIKRIIIGYAKKVIIADTFAAQIALIDAKMATNSTDSLTVWILGLLYFFMIYYDFAGYSDIAIGLSSILGFDIGENFDRPYLSASPAEFWRRWHISLGNWFREYIYIPLGGNRKGNMYINILITFLIAALWHRWSLNVLLWGVLNGAIVIADKAWKREGHDNKSSRFMGILLTVLLVFFGWMLFRAVDFTCALGTFKSLVVSPGGSLPNFTWQFFMTKRTAVFLIVAAAGAFGALRKIGVWIKLRMSPEAYELADKILLLILFALDIMFVLGNPYTPFVYSMIP